MHDDDEWATAWGGAEHDDDVDNWLQRFWRWLRVLWGIVLLGPDVTHWLWSFFWVFGPNAAHH